MSFVAFVFLFPKEMTLVKPVGLGIIGLHHQHPRWYHPLWSNLPQYRQIQPVLIDRSGQTGYTSYW